MVSVMATCKQNSLLLIDEVMQDKLALMCSFHHSIYQYQLVSVNMGQGGKVSYLPVEPPLVLLIQALSQLSPKTGHIKLTRGLSTSGPGD